MLMQESTEQATDELVLGPLRPRRRRLVPAVAGVVAIAIIAVAVGVATRPDSHPTRRITSMGDRAPDTTVTAVPATVPPTSVPEAARPSPTAPPAAGPTPTTTTAPSPAIAPNRTRPAGMNYTPEAVWPETLAELDRIQAAVDQGRLPWRNDPVEVARTYLADRGLSGPTVGPFRATAHGAGSVDYTVGGMGGQVDLQRLLNGSIWYVVGSRSATFPGLQVDRKGGSVVVVAQSGADGVLTARAKHPGGEWGAGQRVQAFAGSSRSITLEAAGGPSADLIVQLRLEGDRTAGVAEIYLGPGAGSVRYSAVDSESRLRVDGLGPVRIGMSLEEARAAAGLPMVLREGPGCVDYRTQGSPAGVGFVSAGAGQRLDFIVVSEPSISTVSGIKVGTTLAEARRAYGDKLAGSLQEGRGKLLFRPDDTSLDHLALALLFNEGKVAAMWAGLRVLMQADEICA